MANGDSNPLPKLALAMVIRNEQRFLEANLAYHRALGVDRIYIFLDRCTDRSQQIAASFSAAEVFHRDRREEDIYMSAHQKRCLSEALTLAREESIDWLMHLDPDEFARGDDPHRRPWSHVRPLHQAHPDLTQTASLPTMLGSLPASVQQVVLRPLDVIPTPLPADAPFHHLDHFQNRGTLTRRILDPTTGEIHRFRQRLGHYKGKAIVRVAADLQPHSAHRWRNKVSSKLNTIRRGLHYHYIAVDGDLWWRKHRKFAEYPDHWEKGTSVRFPRQAWKEASMTMSQQEARAYFDRWVAVNPRRLRVPRLTGSVVRDDFVQRVITQWSG